MSVAAPARLAQWSRAALALVLVAGAGAMAFVFATFPQKYERRMEWFEVIRGTVKLRNDPVVTPGVTAILYPGCTFHATRRRARGWVHVVVDDGAAGWVQEAALEEATARSGD